jgi:hypothetical protein
MNGKSQLLEMLLEIQSCVILRRPPAGRQTRPRMGRSLKGTVEVEGKTGLFPPRKITYLVFFLAPPCLSAPRRSLSASSRQSWISSRFGIVDS